VTGHKHTVAEGSEAFATKAAAHLESYSICLGYLQSWKDQWMTESEQRMEAMGLDE